MTKPSATTKGYVLPFVLSVSPELYDGSNQTTAQTRPLMSAAEPIEQIRLAQIAIEKRHESKPDPETANHTDEHEAVEHDESWDDSEEFEGFPFEPMELNEELKTTKTPQRYS
ncbi:hypothetical protein NM208_g7680 [Fusarium decemcellulare]|uniref:Uncharacterized protein n=1 Tax=Fusarium decemcellulare TaxID=57161 RepID=A0ACC1S8C9_9HYPO|nr:hypothetical protein NM208_g7680 [Fusarium decemcellulare]